VDRPDADVIQNDNTGLFCCHGSNNQPSQTEDYVRTLHEFEKGEHQRIGIAETDDVLYRAKTAIAGSNLPQCIHVFIRFLILSIYLPYRSKVYFVDV
jgi:hypothetical protein